MSKKAIISTEKNIRDEFESTFECLEHIVNYKYEKMTPEIEKSVNDAKQQIERMKELRYCFGENYQLMLIPHKAFDSFIQQFEYIIDMDSYDCKFAIIPCLDNCRFAISFLGY